MMQVKSTDSTIDTYLKKRRRYFSLLDKKHKLVPLHLLDGSPEDIHQFCILDEATEKKLNLQKVRQQFRDAESDLLKNNCDVSNYDIGNEFVREVLISNILKQNQLVVSDQEPDQCYQLDFQNT